MCRTSVMLQIGHFEGQSERTPGSIGQKYSVSDEIVAVEVATAVSRAQ